MNAQRVMAEAIAAWVAEVDGDEQVAEDWMGAAAAALRALLAGMGLEVTE